jgi:hypothetical protein
MAIPDIAHHLEATLYTALSQETMSKITDEVLEEMMEWQKRSLDPLSRYATGRWAFLGGTGRDKPRAAEVGRSLRYAAIYCAGPDAGARRWGCFRSEPRQDRPSRGTSRRSRAW